MSKRESFFRKASRNLREKLGMKPPRGTWSYGGSVTIRGPSGEIRIVSGYTARDVCSSFVHKRDGSVLKCFTSAEPEIVGGAVILRPICWTFEEDVIIVPLADVDKVDVCYINGLIENPPSIPSGWEIIQD